MQDDNIQGDLGERNEKYNDEEYNRGQI